MTLPTAPTTEPEEIRAGDNARWTISEPNYPANDGWTLSYALTKQPSGELIQFSATTNGINHSVNVAPGITGAWQPGTYSVARIFTASDGSRFTQWVGTIPIVPNLDSVGQGDTRSHARRMVDMLNAVMEQRATDDILDSVIEGVAIRRLPIDQLLMLRDRYQTLLNAEIAQENIDKGVGNRKKILVRITAPT